MTVRTAAGEDVAAVTDMWVALADEQRDYGSHLLADANRERARDLVRQYVHADSCAVAVRDGVLVGFVMYHVETGLYDTEGVRGVVDNLYVVPDIRGDGVGSALLDRAEADLRDRDADVVAVEALSANEGARRLYERRGYAPHRITFEKPVESDTHTKDPD